MASSLPLRSTSPAQPVLRGMHRPSNACPSSSGTNFPVNGSWKRHSHLGASGIAPEGAKPPHIIPHSTYPSKRFFADEPRQCTIVEEPVQRHDTEIGP